MRLITRLFLAIIASLATMPIIALADDVPMPPKSRVPPPAIESIVFINDESFAYLDSHGRVVAQNQDNHFTFSPTFRGAQPEVRLAEQNTRHSEGGNLAYSAPKEFLAASVDIIGPYLWSYKDRFVFRQEARFLCNAPTTYWLGRCVAFSPDGRYLAVGSTLVASKFDGRPSTIQFWSTEDIEKGIGNLERFKELNRIDDQIEVRDLVFSSDSSLLAACGSYPPSRFETPARKGKRGGVVCCWNVESGQLVHEIHTGNDTARIVRVTPDRKRIVFCDGSLRWASLAEGGISQKLPIEDEQLAMDLSPDGIRLATGGKRGQVLLWDVSKNSIIARLGKPASKVTCLTISPSGKIIAAGRDDGSIDFWDMPSQP